MRIHQLAPVQSAAAAELEEEVQKLKEDLATTTARCTQLDEANRAWSQYHQNQLDAFRDSLQERITLDSELDLGQMAVKIIGHLDELKTDSQSGTTRTTMPLFSHR